MRLALCRMLDVVPGRRGASLPATEEADRADAAVEVWLPRRDKSFESFWRALPLKSMSRLAALEGSRGEFDRLGSCALSSV